MRRREEAYGARFHRVFAAHAISVSGDALLPVALSFAVLDLTGSAADLGIVLAARTVPTLCLLLVGGVGGDRWSRTRVMAASQLASCFAQAATAALTLTGAARLWHLIALQALYGGAAAFFRPAATAVVPEIVEPALLRRANALLGLARSVAYVVGPAVAGLLVAIVGPAWALALDAVTFGGSAALLLRVSTTRSEAADASLARALREGWSEFVARRWLWQSVLYFSLFQMVVLSSFQVLGPAYARDRLGGVGAWATITACMGIGSLLGRVAIARVETRRPLRVGFTGLLTWVPLLVSMTFAPVALVAVLACVAQAAMSAFVTLWYTALQSEVPRSALSRVSACDAVCSSALLPLGYAVAGPAAAIVGRANVLVGAALWLAAMTLLLLWAGDPPRLGTQASATSGSLHDTG